MHDASSISNIPLRNDLVPLVGEVGDADELVDVCGNHFEDCFVFGYAYEQVKGKVFFLAGDETKIDARRGRRFLLLTGDLSWW